MGTSKPPVVVAVVEDDAASRTALGRVPQGPFAIIMTTSSHETVIQERAHQNGCAAFFCKPVDGNILTATIASVANR